MIFRTGFSSSYFIYNIADFKKQEISARKLKTEAEHKSRKKSDNLLELIGKKQL